MIQLQTVEQKLLSHDPTFTYALTHVALTSQRSALISAFRPQYDDGDIQGAPYFSLRASLILTPLPRQATRAST